ncbi:MULTISPECIES: N-acetylmuramoyl-L-alanine amidase [Erwinia]|uniref:N-acetylmuramoyl-L-alanine amidase n=1 Tax=Erwinia pyrifoliae TaxID=79967 RepID=A0ABY5X500_ERWPY|nr:MULTISPECIES: N-acetylmuramoyl-L-alanine amidase [Erwinia]AUX72253.1 N-acetylmuramoyl-L-alanine amidase [Erwinia pyrifoliae]MCA8877506.1 N-acetylmuramoyl-L-alanine amidase [Erwinia pyrifoliae]MCT2388504.1 N-acetylmuramoyl-L-alanine amidase [Erwinia pyrifoliae]MCU8586673.1 N-acetylmuramoyl-L-alanine amidase [Erwinia pyrifoliae]UWS30558.1 N-acetylmuramoyl-L-alanine amidase [Erwinia pyrifoliae]
MRPLSVIRPLWVLLAISLYTSITPQGLQPHQGYMVDTREEAYGARPRIKVLVIHYTAGDFPRSLNVLTDRSVSAHYLLPAAPPKYDGQPLVWRLVPESMLAWHAGISFWRGATRLNDTSIGIELENPGWHRTDSGVSWAPFPAAQMAALLPLMRDIVQRYAISPQDVVAHSDIAPLRKQDPGPLFPWRWLAGQGVGAWPDDDRVAYYLAGRPASQRVDKTKLLGLLASYGYDVPGKMMPYQLQALIAAFQMHFRPSDYRGIADAETEAIAAALLEKYGAQ